MDKKWANESISDKILHAFLKLACNRCREEQKIMPLGSKWKLTTYHLTYLIHITDVLKSKSNIHDLNILSEYLQTCCLMQLFSNDKYVQV